MEPIYILCTIDPQGRRFETQTGTQRCMDKRASKLNEFAVKIGAETRWETYPSVQICSETVQIP